MIGRTEIEAALAEVYDPCSVQANAPLSVIDMGLVTAIEITDAGVVHISMRPTSAWCTMIGSIMQGVEEKLCAISGVSAVEIAIHQDKPWSEADLTPAGSAILNGVRARSRAAAPVRRRQWQGRAATTTNEV
jgi:metal-sulfur cluster biosynthetic enzyme